MSDRPMAAIAEPPRKEIAKIPSLPNKPFWKEVDTTMPHDELPVSPETPYPFPITPSGIRFGDKYAVIHNVVKGLDQRLTPPTDIAYALISKAIDNGMYSSYDWQKLEGKRKKIPWPRSATMQVQILPHADETWFEYNSHYGKREIGYVIKPQVSKTFPGGLHLEEADYTILEQVAAAVVDSLPLGEQEKVVEWIKHLNRKDFYLPSNDVFLIWHEKSKERWSKRFIEGLAQHHSEYQFSRYTNLKPTLTQESLLKPGYIDSLDFRPENPRSAEVFIDQVIERPADEQTMLLTIAIDHFDLPNVLTAIRNAYQDPSYTNEERQSLESLGRKALGIQDQTLPFHANLNSVYESLKDFFAEYQPNVEANQRELEMIQHEIKKEINQRRGGTAENFTGITVVDLGCGTGRIANGLAQSTPGIKEIIGIDSSPDLLSVAGSAYEQLATITTPVKYQQGDWNGFEYIVDENGNGDWKSNLNIAPTSADAIICIGRTLTHAEDEPRFNTIMKQVYRSLKDDGEFVFDFPDPDKGAYKENRLQLLHSLQQLGLPIDETFLPKLDYVVDSADGKNLYNRYVPQIDYLKELMAFHGFALEELQRTPIAGDNWLGSENVYFVAKKLPGDPPSKYYANLKGWKIISASLHSTPDQMSPASYEQYEDD